MLATSASSFVDLCPLFDHIFFQKTTHQLFFPPGQEVMSFLRLYHFLEHSYPQTRFSPVSLRTTQNDCDIRIPGFDPSSFAHTVRFTLLRCYSDFNSAWILTAVLRRGFTTFSHQRVHISDVSCGLNILACSSNCSRLPSLEFQPPLHHGRTVAAILLEPLPHAAATTSAADLHRRRHHKPFHQPPVIQSYRHLWSSHPRSSHSPHAPHTTLHTIAAAQSIPADSTFAARVSTTTTTTATPHHGASHPARPIFSNTARSHRTPLANTSAPPPPPHVPSPKPTIQDSWHQTDHHPTPSTATSSTEQFNAGVAGLPTLDIFPWQLAYHGTAEYTARTLSHGKYCGFIATRSVAESVFVTHLLQEIREKRLDLDAIAETLHTSQGNDIPSKTTQARAFHAPLINLLIQQLQSHSPAPAEGTALRALKSANDELARAKQKLHNLGVPFTPTKGTSHSSSAADASHPATTTPPPPAHKPPVLADVLQPPHPSLKDDVPDTWNTTDIQQWVTTFDPAVQESANEILRLLQTSKVTTQQLKEAATRYGLPLGRVNRLPIRSLQHLVSVGAATGC